MNLSLREIEYVLTVAAEENITRAAEKLYIAQPSLSQAIKKIEDEIGHPLFTRVRNRIKLTEEGQLFVEAGQHINKTVRDLENKLHGLSQIDFGHLSIGMPLHLGAFVIPKALSIYKKRFPNVDIELHENTSSELENMIVNGTVDLAIMPLPFGNPNICFQPLLSSRMVLIMAKDNPLNAFAYDAGLGEKYQYFNLKKAANEPFIIGNRGQRIRSVTELIFKKAAISPRIALYSKNIETIKNIAATGVGLAIIPEQYLKQEDEKLPANVYYLNGDQDYSWTIAAAFANSSYLSPAANQFIQVLRDYIAAEEKKAAIG
jgi:DNA-binding transcriptional LysR family regulator